MFKACSRCGKIHPTNYQCTIRRAYNGGRERALRSTYAWTQKSKDIRGRSLYLCAVCRDQGRYTYDDLEVHHIEKLKDNEELLLDDSNLICLCSFHHKQADNGELSKDYLYSLVQAREE